MNNGISQPVLVTGASGFIGLHLVRGLVTVFCLVRPTSHIDLLKSAGAELVSADVTDPDSIRRA